MASLLSAACIVIGFFVFTMSTVTPLDNIGVITMKMMSITSITSTIGVTLISATGGGALCFFSSLSAISVSPRTPQEPGSSRELPANQLTGALTLLPDAALRTLQEVVDQFGTGVAHLHVESFNLVREVVEHPDRGNRHEQTDSGGHQRFRNTAGDGAQTGRLLVRNALERVDDADDRSEQTHERGRRTDGCQTAHTALQFSVNNGFGAFQSTLRC